MHFFAKIVLAGTSTLFFGPHLSAAESSQEEIAFFESKIRPVLVKECFGCHSSQSGNVRGGLRLDSQFLTRSGGSSGPAVVPGDPDASLLLSAMRHEDWEMPPRKKLSDDVIEDFRKWIEMGAPDPRVEAVAEVQGQVSDQDVARAKETFWAYQSPMMPTLPNVEQDWWPSGSIDHFVLDKLEQAGLGPAGDATDFVVLRRLCFDLVGLPPTVTLQKQFGEAWLKDPQQAVEDAVEKLLAMNQFGERWGRHWLDVARYAESTGREVNMTYPYAWRYRDYVIDAFNNDKPFNEFAREQIAGDLIPVATDEQWASNLIATTFLAIGPKNVNEQNRLQFKADLIDEQIDAVTRVFLGTSVSCARCHDHKFDAIAQQDYYSLVGIFQNAQTYFGIPPSEYGSYSFAQLRRQSSLLKLPVQDVHADDKKYSASELDDLHQQIRDVQNSLSELRRSGRSAAQGGANAQRTRLRLLNQITSLSAKLSVVDENGIPNSYCMGVQDLEGQYQDARILMRGEIDLPAQSVRRGFPRVLCLHSETVPESSSGRLEFASWVGSDRNPLTARVLVNRLWKNLFGEGLVRSTENFGVTGQSPSHPALLDYLAVQLIRSGWSMKTIIREIATSHLYRTASDFSEEAHLIDSDNTLLWQFPARQLDAESIRDSMLSVSGEIDYSRPRGSEVSKAGYQRVVGSFLGDPRELNRRAMQMAGQAVRNSNSVTASPRNFPPSRITGQSRAFSQGSRFDGIVRDQFRLAVEESLRKITSQLDMEDALCRSIYLPSVRDHEPRSLVVFDFADSSIVVGKRESSNTANQSLYLMNNSFVIERSEAFADRLSKHSSRLVDQIQYGFQLAFNRHPTFDELSKSVEFVKAWRTESKVSNRNEGLATFCQSLFASADFRYLD